MKNLFIPEDFDALKVGIRAANIGADDTSIITILSIQKALEENPELTLREVCTIAVEADALINGMSEEAEEESPNTKEE